MTKKTFEELAREASANHRTSISSSAGMPPNGIGAGFGAGQLFGALLTGLGAAAVGEVTHEMAKENADLQLRMAKAIYEKGTARGSSPAWDDATDATKHLYLEMSNAAFTVVHRNQYGEAKSKYERELEIEEARREMHAWVRDLATLDALADNFDPEIEKARDVARHAAKIAAVAYFKVVNRS